MTPYNYLFPVYYHVPIPVDGKSLTGPEFVGLIFFLVILAAWALAVILLSERLEFDDNNKQDKKKHAIELIVLIAIGLITLAAAIIYCD